MNGSLKTLSPAESSRHAVAWALSLSLGVVVCLAAGNPKMLLYAGAAAALASLLWFPEIGLAMYVLIGDVKGDDRIAALIPFDWTVTLCIVILAGLVLNLLRGKRVAAIPPAYFALAVCAEWMALSLTYAPNFDGGLDKLGRFLTITGIAILAPFFALGTPAAMKRFLWAFGLAAFAICAYALLGLGGEDRLVS